MSTFLKKRLLLPLLLVGITLGALVGGCGKEEQIKVSDTRFSMDTFVKIDAYSDKPGEPGWLWTTLCRPFKRSLPLPTVTATAAPVLYMKLI